MNAWNFVSTPLMRIYSVVLEQKNDFIFITEFKRESEDVFKFRRKKNFWLRL